MARKSAVSQLPKAVRRQLDQLIIEDKLTLDELCAFLASKVENPPSRSSVWRHTVNEREAKAALRESREIARGIAQELGPESVESEQGRLLVEMLRSIVFKGLIGKVSNPEAEFDPAEISRLTRSVRDLAQAMHLEQDFAKRIREEERKRALEEMNEKLNSAASNGTLDSAVAQEARRILGFSDE